MHHRLNGKWPRLECGVPSYLVTKSHVQSSLSWKWVVQTVTQQGGSFKRLTDMYLKISSFTYVGSAFYQIAPCQVTSVSTQSSCSHGHLWRRSSEKAVIVKNRSNSWYTHTLSVNLLLLFMHPSLLYRFGVFLATWLMHTPPLMWAKWVQSFTSTFDLCPMFTAHSSYIPLLF